MVGLLIPFESSLVQSGTLPSPTPFARATGLLTCLPTMTTPLISAFILIVLTPTRLIEPSGMIM
ncbi:hypothetical protein LINPERHAP2_LOCUS15722 [Linum perenne]